ncbi:MAG: DUF2059 domain-containing protein [Hyphomicrobiaceae bacterium]
MPALNRIPLAFIVTTALALSNPAYAQQPSSQQQAQPQATPEPDAKHVAAAEALVKAMDARGQTLASIERLKQALIMRIRANEPQKAVGFTAYTDRELDPNGERVQKFLSEMNNIAVQFYARNFTPQEMQAIAQFQQSAAGRKYNQIMPELGGLIAQRMNKFQAEVLQAVHQGAALSTQK